MRLTHLAPALFGIALVFAARSAAQTAAPANGALPPPQQELVVGTKQAPPLAIKDVDGNWGGISIDLWRRIAEQAHFRYRIVEETEVQALIDGVADGKYDVAVSALTVTAAREQIVDFTEPFYVTGLGIAVPANTEASWLPIIRTLTSFGFAQTIATLAGLALAVGFVIWLIERRHNENFSGGVGKGIAAGVWWSTVAMTQRNTGAVGPNTLAGRVVAMLWMIGSIIALAVFTASITSTLTIKHLQGAVHGVSDLSAVRVGVVAGTSSEDGLSRMKIAYRKYATPEDGLNALRRNALEAFVYDKPLLAWIIRQNFASSVELIDATFDSQEYAFAVPPGSALRKPLSIAILEQTHSAWWEETTFRYLGSRQ